MKFRLWQLHANVVQNADSSDLFPCTSATRSLCVIDGVFSVHVKRFAFRMLDLAAFREDPRSRIVPFKHDLIKKIALELIVFFRDFVKKS